MYITDLQNSPLKDISDISGNLAYRGQIISGGGSTGSFIGGVTGIGINGNLIAGGINLQSAGTVSLSQSGQTIIFHGSGGTGIGNWSEIADEEVPDSERDFNVEWQSNGDTNGFFYLLGRNFNLNAWTNPHNSNAVTCIISNGWTNMTASQIVGRESTQHAYSSNSTGNYLAVDLKTGIVITDYSLRSNDETSYKPRNWNLQGSNNVSNNTVTGINAASWDNLDIRINDSTIANSADAWGHFILSATPPEYRWIRIINTGKDSSGIDSYLTACEIEIYCGLYAVFTPRIRPEESRFWITNGVYYVPAW